MATVEPQVTRDRAADQLGEQLTALRALCELVATGGTMTRSATMTVSLDPAGTGAAFLRAAARVAEEFDMDERTSIAGGRGTVRISRPR